MHPLSFSIGLLLLLFSEGFLSGFQYPPTTDRINYSSQHKFSRRADKGRQDLQRQSLQSFREGLIICEHSSFNSSNKTRVRYRLSRKEKGSFEPYPVREQSQRNQHVTNSYNSSALYSPFDFNDEICDQREGTTRRFALSSLILSVGIAFGTELTLPSPSIADGSSLKWETSPVNKRSGVTVFQAEKGGYNIRFVTYLSRFLLSFDAECQRWWYGRAGDIPRSDTAEQVNDIRLGHFAAFSASVEVGLQEYLGPDGPRRLMNALLYRYCPDLETLKRLQNVRGQTPLTLPQAERQIREVREAQRQIALLFGLLEINQPVDEITKLLGRIDNACIDSVIVQDPGAGYAPGYASPRVLFPPPDAGDGYTTALGRARLRPNGNILRIDIVKRGKGYTKVPVVTISPPKGVSHESQTSCASAKAFIFRDGANRGSVERIQLVDTGNHYSLGEPIRVEVSPPDSDVGEQATATAVLEYEVNEIEIVDGGSGYATEKPIKVYVEPPPLTARVNINDPMLTRVTSHDEPLPLTAITTPQLLKKRSSSDDPSSVSSRVWNEAKVGGGGGCIGRACYDKPVIAVAFPRAKYDSYTSFRTADDSAKLVDIEVALQKRSASSIPTNRRQNIATREISLVSSGPTVSTAGTMLSIQLLTLLPSGIGLLYNESLGRYELTETDMSNENTLVGERSSPIDPEFGPRGRVPIERDKNLDLDKLIRVFLSGAICCSSVHIVLTPIDVVKTRIQTDPDKYTDIMMTLKTVATEQGLSGFFSGWAPTIYGFFIFGGVTFTAAEWFRRYYSSVIGPESTDLEIPIILAAAATSAIFGAFTVAPFEAIRIRSVAQPGYASGFPAVVNRMVKEEGLLSLFSAVPAFLAKEIPFSMAKFAVFDLTTTWLYNNFPAAQEDLQLSLLVSLTGGTLGGITASVVSNPADATISEMKKSKSELGPLETAKKLVGRGGITALFRGLGLRIFFYSLIVSLQFFVYDTVRFSLGVSSDDLKQYLDVLGGALQESGGPL